MTSRTVKKLNNTAQLQDLERGVCFEYLLISWKKTCSLYKSSQQRLHLKHSTFQSIITHINSVGWGFLG